MNSGNIFGAYHSERSSSLVFSAAVLGRNKDDTLTIINVKAMNLITSTVLLTVFVNSLSAINTLYLEFEKYSTMRSSSIFVFGFS